MGVTFSNPQNNNQTVASTTNSFAYDCTGASALVIHVGTSSTTGSTGATYNGVAMTLATRDTTSFISEIYYLMNPATGSNTLTVTWAGTQQSFVIAGCVAGCSTSGVGASGSSTGGTTTTPQVTITTQGANSGIFIGMTSNIGASVTDIGSQSRFKSQTGTGIIDTYGSTATEATAASHTYGYTQTSTQACCSALEFKIAPAVVGASNMLSMGCC